MRSLLDHIIHNSQLFIVSRALSSQPGVIYVNHNPELFIASRALSSQPRVLSSQPRVFPVIESP